jgi:aminopeptidase YwaD
MILGTKGLFTLAKKSTHYLVKQSLAFVDKIIKKTGPRLTGTKATLKAAKIIQSELKQSCDSVKIESFNVRPKSFLGFIQVTVALYFIASVLIFFKLVEWGTIFFILASGVMLTQFIFYWEVLDPFYSKKKGYNVYGTLEPAGSATQQIIISGHHDSAYEFRYMTHIPKIYGIRILLVSFSLAFSTILTIVWSIIKLTSGIMPFYADVLRYSLIVSWLWVIPFYYFSKNKGTPGAGDNLISVGIAITLAKFFGERRKKGISLLEHTRLIFISFDAEECGLRGSRKYVKTHKEELKSIPTYVINADSIYNADKIRFVANDINSIQPLSKDLTQDLQKVATELGYATSIVNIIPGAGATDAASFAQQGIKAASILAMPTAMNEKHGVYHTQKDTIDSIEPEAVNRVLRIIYSYILFRDQQVQSTV